MKSKKRGSKPSKNKALRTKARVSVGVIMGSDSDWRIMKSAVDVLVRYGVTYEAEIVSAHRTPREMMLYAESARARGLKLIIAGAGGAAHLPGMVASLTELPVIGVPIALKGSDLDGLDALLSVVQMPKGVPVATVAVDGAENAGILAVQILGIASATHLDQIADHKAKLRKQVLSKRLEA